MDVSALIDRPLDVRISTWRYIYWSVGCSRKWGSTALWGFSSTFKHHTVTRLGELHRNRNQTWTWITVRTTGGRQLSALGAAGWKPATVSCFTVESRQTPELGLVRAFKRERVMIIHTGHKTDELSTEALPRSELKWGFRQDGKGTLHFLMKYCTGWHEK